MENLAPNYVRCAIQSEVKAVNSATREVAHLITTGSVDRAGDVVEPGGADVGNYMKNPVVLRDHSYKSEDIIGKATSVEITKDGIWARTQFLDSDVGRDAYNLVAEGIGGWSIGFRPVEYDSIKDDKGKTKGFRFKKWELLEYSQVAIPMNQDIVNSMVQRGLMHEENVHLFFTTTEQTEHETAVEPEKSADSGPTAESPDDAHELQPANHPILAEILGAAVAEIAKAKRDHAVNVTAREGLKNVR